MLPRISHAKEFIQDVLIESIRKKHFDRWSILHVKFNFYNFVFRSSSNHQMKSALTFTSANCIGSPSSSIMIFLYRVVHCKKPDRATAAMARCRYDVYLDCWAVSCRLLFHNSSVASIQFLRWLLHGTKPLGMIYSLVLCTPDFFMCHFDHIFLNVVIWPSRVFFSDTDYCFWTSWVVHSAEMSSPANLSETN